ncbi:TIGR03013 family PEP-CTERM/XrtA system glycosyltransferase [Aestuariirhabdus sp. Z084]|uniref:TIGR03013 family XrtA/PEP-CTERM system glycosyltransferase n=1 Tax=Aestuariirhabdus haliotis TaxID=2918751 RepID=UPI00201B416F|nr:TIGR03013 family XrtA/PEP-CTERM system glycosyltransferase [Aestuariirhabdus haliotis]MCL6414705.1 TIGR03013 family PEP-CTERM/XrtA system glycosyltransferase [Aestuariirhabdus haliotis]MCL6418637.1 TIGR03013 family PEP-CTERM/XrtA system glycosyltransferase [Aestuariirhabdus haliotis]
MSSIRIFKHHVRTPYLILGLLEFALFFTGIFCAIWLRYGSLAPELSNEELLPLTYRAGLVSATFVVCMYALGMYQSRLREGSSGLVLRTLISFTIANLTLALFYFLVPELIIGRGVFFISAVINLLFLSATRLVFGKLVDEKVLRVRVMVLGAGERASRIAKRFRRQSDRRGFKIVGYLPANDQEPMICTDRAIITDMSLSNLCVAHQIDEVVVAVDDRRQGLPVKDLVECKMLGIDVIDEVSFFERETGKIEIDLLSPGWIIFADGFHNGLYKLETRRLFDILIALTLLIITSPLILATYLAIKLDDGFSAPALFRQIRTGLGGEPFELIKFRSMVIDAEKDGAVWASKNDPRTTRIGKILRTYRFDELPQLINVLRGDMSFVGPRPERPEFIEQLKEQIPYYDERHRIKPGLAGWAQLCYPYGATINDARQKFKYDLYYLKNHSLFLDILILIQTAEVILFGKGAR